MIRCSNCGTANLDGSEYCDECGTKLDLEFRTSAPVRGRNETPAYQPPMAGGIDTIGPAERIDGNSSSRGVLEPRLEPGTPRTSEGPLPAPPAFTTSTSIPKPVKPLRPVEHRMVEEEVARPGQTLVLSSRGRTDVLRPEQPVSANPSNGTALSKLVIERGGRVGKEFPITAFETQIGRWDADSGIFPDVDLDQDDPEAKVSRRHARIINNNGQFYIEDLGSTNGTFINRGRRLLPGHRQMLHSGDEIIVGKTFLKFQILR